jgi:hypothetical protein
MCPLQLRFSSHDPSEYSQQAEEAVAAESAVAEAETAEVDIPSAASPSAVPGKRTD